MPSRKKKNFCRRSGNITPSLSSDSSSSAICAKERRDGQLQQHAGWKVPSRVDASAKEAGGTGTAQLTPAGALPAGCSDSGGGQGRAWPHPRKVRVALCVAQAVRWALLCVLGGIFSTPQGHFSPWFPGRDICFHHNLCEQAEVPTSSVTGRASKDLCPRAS